MPLRSEQCGERLAAYKIHPEANAPVVAIYSANRNDVQMAHLRQRQGLAQQVLRPAWAPPGPGPLEITVLLLNHLAVLLSVS